MISFHSNQSDHLLSDIQSTYCIYSIKTAFASLELSASKLEMTNKFPAQFLTAIIYFSLKLYPYSRLIYLYLNDISRTCNFIYE